MEPTIYKPSIYKGAGIYKIGSGGGGVPTIWDGKQYTTAIMPDGKEWLCQNLDYKIGDIGNTGDCAYYNNDEDTYGWNGYKCGLLYNYDAVHSIEIFKDLICPGWHVPTITEWQDLINSVNGNIDKLKCFGGWPPYWNGTNDFNFSAIPSGLRKEDKTTFDEIGLYFSFWSISSLSESLKYYGWFGANNDYSINTAIRDFGFSVRLVKD